MNAVWLTTRKYRKAELHTAGLGDRVIIVGVGVHVGRFATCRAFPLYNASGITGGSRKVITNSFKSHALVENPEILLPSSKPSSVGEAESVDSVIDCDDDASFSSKCGRFLPSPRPRCRGH